MWQQIKKQMQDRFTAGMYGRLWWPAMLSCLGWACSDMADAVVVGQRFGATGLAAISLILPVYMFNCVMAHSFGLGGSVHFSNLLGKGEEKAAHRYFLSVLWCSLLFSAVTAILGSLFLQPLLALLGTVPEDGELFYATRDYLQILVLASPLFYLSNILNYFLRNDSCQKRAGIGSLVGNLCDIFCNFVLVLVLDMGTRGAALSTVVGQVLAISIYMPALWQKQHHLVLGRVSWIELWQGLQGFAAGFATSVQYLYKLLFFLLCNNVLLRMGGENAVAIFDIIQNTSYLILYLYDGNARAAQPLLSTYYGECNLTGRKNALVWNAVTGVSSGSLLIGIVMLFPGALCTLFGVTDPALCQQAGQALRIYCVGAFFAGISILAGNYYQSCEHLKAPFLLETFRGGLVLLPCTLLFSFLGIHWFWWLFPVTEVISLALFLLWKKATGYRVQTVDPQRVFQRMILNSEKNLVEVCGQMEEFCSRWNALPKQEYLVSLAMEELGMAILTQGISTQKKGYLQITLVASPEGNFQLHLRDNAKQFNPFAMVAEPVNIADNHGKAKLDGLGILILQQKAKSFFYQRYQGFNNLVITI